MEPQGPEQCVLIHIKREYQQLHADGGTKSYFIQHTFYKKDPTGLGRFFFLFQNRDEHVELSCPHLFSLGSGSVQRLAQELAGAGRAHLGQRSETISLGSRNCDF